jgi:uncharacterized protein with PIN domain
LLKLYLSEPGSREFNETVEGRNDLLVSDLAVTETVCALARPLRQGQITPRIARRIQHPFSLPLMEVCSNAWNSVRTFIAERNTCS